LRPCRSMPQNVACFSDTRRMALAEQEPGREKQDFHGCAGGNAGVPGRAPGSRTEPVRTPFRSSRAGPDERPGFCPGPRRFHVVRNPGGAGEIRRLSLRVVSVRPRRPGNAVASLHHPATGGRKRTAPGGSPVSVCSGPTAVSPGLQSTTGAWSRTSTATFSLPTAAASCAGDKAATSRCR